MNIKRIQGGTKAKAFGALFEDIFYLTCKKNGIAITRFPDGCRTISKNQLIRVKTPFDWILTLGGKTALIDTKTTDTDFFSHSKITEHQIVDMAVHEKQGAIAGYVIWFRKTDEVIFMNALTLLDQSLKKGSIKSSHPSAKILGVDSSFNVSPIFF